MRFIIVAQLIIRMKKIVSFVNVREISSQYFQKYVIGFYLLLFCFYLYSQLYKSVELYVLVTRGRHTYAIRIKCIYTTYMRTYIFEFQYVSSLRISFNRYLIILLLYKFFKRVLFLPNILVLLSLINPSHVYVMHAYTRVCMYARVYYKCIHIYNHVILIKI